MERPSDIVAGGRGVAIRIQVKDAATGATLDMDLDPGSTVQEALKSAATYWGKNPKAYVLRKDRKTLRGSLTMVKARIAEGDKLEFVTEAEASRPVLILEADGGRQLAIERPAVLGRADFESFLTKEAELSRISNRHLSVSEHLGMLAIEDGVKGQPSRNGTTLNGQDLRGRGRVPIREGDVLRIAGVLDVRVRILSGN